jgi:hypothetical protein
MKRDVSDVGTSEAMPRTDKITTRFRCAALQLEELKRIEVAMSDTTLAALAKLPKDLNETYEHILTSIDDVLHQRALTAL